MTVVAPDGARRHRQPLHRVVHPIGLSRMVGKANPTIFWSEAWRSKVQGPAPWIAMALTRLAMTATLRFRTPPNRLCAAPPVDQLQP